LLLARDLEILMGFLARVFGVWGEVEDHGMAPFYVNLK